MKLIKRTIAVLSAALIMIVLVPTVTKAADKPTSKELVKSINSQLCKAKNITAKAYLGKISKNNYLSTVAVNTKDNILYADWYTLGIDKFYSCDNKMYIYNTDMKKWEAKKPYARKHESFYDISSTASTKLLNDRNFNGKKCYALQVKIGRSNCVYYVKKNNKKLIGIVSASGSKKVYTTIDTDKPVKVPAYVISGRQVNCDTNTKEDIKVTAMVLNGKMDNIKINTYSELRKYIEDIKGTDEYEENKKYMTYVMRKLESYDKSYFKKKSLYLKNFENGMPIDLYAVKKTASSGKISISMAEYYTPHLDYPAVCQSYIIFIEADSKSASSIKDVKISRDRNYYIVPNGI